MSAEGPLEALARRFYQPSIGAKVALSELEAFLPEDPVPPLSPRKLLKRPDPRKRRRQLVRAARRVNRG